jgi:bifunctional oligoribonuclease and PAP phosphatase NrnA
VFDLAKYTKELRKLFESSHNILLISHVNPDGDAIGSQLALYHYLTYKEKNTKMISPNHLQEFSKWMDGSGEIHVFIKDRKACIKLIREADLIILIDFNQSNRLGEAEKYITESTAVKVIIDHHQDPFNIADLIISDSAKCSTAELIYELITGINREPFINKSYSEAVYVGIITDTGNFEYGTYTGNTLRIIADILDSGIQRDKILNVVYNSFSVDRMRLQGLALNKRMIVLPEYKTAYIYLTRQDLSEYNHIKGDTEGFVNLPLSIRGINFSALFIEKENFVKLSFRSKGNFPVNEFASRYFSGGGHVNASGGEFYDSLENTISYFLTVLKENAGRLNGEL